MGWLSDLFGKQTTQVELHNTYFGGDNIIERYDFGHAQPLPLGFMGDPSKPDYAVEREYTNGRTETVRVTANEMDVLRRLQFQQTMAEAQNPRKRNHRPDDVESVQALPRAKAEEDWSYKGPREWLDPKWGTGK